MKLTYGMIENIISSKVINIKLPLEIKKEVYKLLEKITDSNVYSNLKKDVIQYYIEEQVANGVKKESISSMPISYPKMIELLNMDSGIEIEKIKIPYKYTDELTPLDMKNSSWFIEYIEGE